LPCLFGKQVGAMKKILAIGGAVIKTAKEELRQYIEAGNVEILIHNGGSIFHDFQNDSIPLEELLKDFSCNKISSSKLIYWFLKIKKSPEKSITNLCESMGIPVYVFTTTMGDFWQLFALRHQIAEINTKIYDYFRELVLRFSMENFHFINMGSAVVHPEIFIKALAVARPKEGTFIADVVDFKPDMYRPLTRVAKYGTYYCMSHKQWLSKELNK